MWFAYLDPTFPENIFLWVFPGPAAAESGSAVSRTTTELGMPRAVDGMSGTGNEQVAQKICRNANLLDTAKEFKHKTLPHLISLTWDVLKKTKACCLQWVYPDLYKRFYMVFIWLKNLAYGLYIYMAYIWLICLPLQTCSHLRPGPASFLARKVAQEAVVKYPPCVVAQRARQRQSSQEGQLRSEIDLYIDVLRCMGWNYRICIRCHIFVKTGASRFRLFHCGFMYICFALISKVDDLTWCDLDLSTWPCHTQADDQILVEPGQLEAWHSRGLRWPGGAVLLPSCNWFPVFFGSRTGRSVCSRTIVFLLNLQRTSRICRWEVVNN